MSRASRSCYRRSTPVKHLAQTMPHPARTLGGAGTSADSHLHAVTGDRHATICLAQSMCNTSLQEGFHLPASELPACQPHLCYVQGVGTHHMQPHQGPPRQTQNSLTATTRLPCILLLWNTVVGHGSRPSYHQGRWTPNRHGRTDKVLYGIQGPTLKWIEAFLGDAETQSIVVNGYHSTTASFTSGVPQGTAPCSSYFFYQRPVMCPWSWNQVLSVCRRLPDLPCHPYNRRPDTDAERPGRIAELEWDLGNAFNAKKCNIVTLARGINPLSYFYQLNNTVLDRVNACNYLGITISENLSWTDHITANAKKANARLGFLHRNLQGCPQPLKQTAYVSLMRSLMEYSSTVWNPTLKKDKEALEKMQRRAARWIQSDYRQWSSVTAMLTDLGLATLEKQRENQKVLLMYKVVHSLIGVTCEELGLERADKCTRASHCHKLRHHQPTPIEYPHSFICSTILEWNKLPASMAEADSVAIFKSQLGRLAD